MKEVNKKHKNNNILIGGLAGICSRTLTAPLELIKISQQNHFMKTSQMKQVWNKEGIKGFWKGNMTNCLRIFPQSAINYSVFKIIETKLEKKNLNKKSLFNNSFISGTISGFVSMICIYPLENARTRLALQVNKQYYNSLFDVFKKTKVFDLYRGLGISLIGYPPYNALSFMLNTYFRENKEKIEYLFQIRNKNMKQNNELNKIKDDIYKLLNGGISGLMAVTITYPTDLLRRRFQIQNMSLEVPKYKNILDCLKQIIQKEGIRGLYRGLGVTYIKIFPAMAIQFYMFEKLQILF